MEFYLDLGMTRSDTQRSPVSSRRFWRRTGCLVLVLLFLGVLVWLLAVGGASGRQSSSTRADIVFVIDATGSMHDEISDVKTSLMSIGNLLANKKPEPDVRFGAVFYRDITDEEIVRVVPLSRDLASVREAIMNVRADGGGDWPEHVGIGLHEALEMDWSHTQNGGVRLVYLVGDAPPKHYSDGYGVDRALDLANDLGVKVHVIGCSGLGNGREEMERIATYTGGVYTEFERQEGGQHMSSKGRYSERTEMAAALRHIIAYSSSVDVMPDSMDVRLESPASVKTDSPVIGIDIGTSYGVVGIFKHGSVEIIPNAEGQRKTPAFVAFSGNETLVGDSAKHYAAKDPSQAFSGLRRIIGRRFSDPVVQEEMEALPYGLVEVKGKPSIRATESGVAKDLPIEKVMAVIIAELRNSAENYLGQEVHNAVLTVPAYFSDAQRQATKEAGVIAGLNVLIINEPTAAAIAYGLDKKTEGNIIVYDLGGGTLDISALTIDSGVFEVLSTAGDTHLGGDDFDRRILQHFVEDIQAKHGLNMSREEHSSALERLRQASEIARHDLSVSQETTVSIDGLISGIAYSTTITKSLFENITWDLLERAREPLVRVVNESGLMPAQFDHILLTGGATRMPQIKALVNSFFSRDHLSDSVNPDEAVAYGAAVVAGSFSAKHGSDLLLLDSSDLLLLDVTPMTLGFTLASSPTEVVPMISRNTVVPTRKTMIVSTAADNQLEISFKIYEGEQPLAEDNRLLGEFHLGGIAPAPKGQPQIEVVFEVDSNGILSVSAQDMHSGKTEKTTITQDKGRLSEDDSEIMVKDVEGYADRDSILRQRIKARERIEAFMETLRHAMNVNESMKMLDAEQEVRIAETLANHTLWLSSNPNASEIDAKHEELEKENAPFIQQSRALEQSKNAKHMFNEFLRVVDLVSSSSDFKFGDEDQMRIRDALSRGLAWIASHPDAKSEAIKAAHREIEIEIINVTSKYHSHHSGDFNDDLPIKSLDDRSDELTLGEAEELHKMGRLSKMMFFSMEAEL